MIDSANLEHHLKDALANYYDPIHLQTHPLARMLGLARQGQTTAEALRKALWDAIEALRPADDITVGRTEWISYRLLWLHYVQSQGKESVCQELGLSQRSFYRRLQEAVRAVASVLQEQCARGAYGSMVANGYEHSDLARAAEQAIRLAQQTSTGLVDLGAVVADALETIRPLVEGSGHGLTADCPTSLQPAHGDPALYHQIFINVLTESLKVAGSRELHLACQCLDTETVIRLSGIPGLARDQALGRLPGVALSRRLLEAYGGRLWFERTSRRDIVICMAVPSVEPPTLLAIDDDADTISLYRRLLQPHGYVLGAARNLQEIQHFLDRTVPDAILLDVLMPGQDGWKLMRWLRADSRTADVPIIICSVLAQPRLALALGARDVLQKPLTEQVLVRAVQRALERQDSPHPTHLAGPADT